MSDTPIDLLASRVWSGSKWHYPHIEAMLSDIERLRAELAAAIKERDEARRLHCVEITRESMNPKMFTPEWSAKQLGWDCFKEGGGS